MNLFSRHATLPKISALSSGFSRAQTCIQIKLEEYDTKNTFDSFKVAKLTLYRKRTNMRRFLAFTLTLAALFLVSIVPFRTTFAQGATSPSTTAKPADVDGIIRAFTAKETEFRQALNQYAFKRDAVIQTIGLGGQITGEYHRVSNFTFDDKSNRFEKISFFPQPTLTEINVTAEDLEDLGGIQPFALEASQINQYNFTYVGKERIDELDLYVFDVAPKVMPNPKKSKERWNVFSKGASGLMIEICRSSRCAGAASRKATSAFPLLRPIESRLMVATGFRPTPLRMRT